MRIFFTFILAVLVISAAQAKHIVGGEATYELISTDGYIGGTVRLKIHFTIYRDAKSGGADFDNPGYFGVFIKRGGSWQFVKRIDKYVQNRKYIKTVHDPCVVTPPNILYEKGEYNFTLDLKISTTEYKITYQRCCRTNFIVNIKSPEATGATYYVDISPDAQLYGDNSPVFRGFPPSVLCANAYFEFDHSCIDKDGDSLVYEFFHPFHGGGLEGSSSGTGGSASDCDGVKPDPTHCPPPYPLVQFKNPYDYKNPLGGTPQVRIEKFSGLIYGTPVDLGQFVVGVKVKAYRNGKLISTVQRDFQFNVTSCSPLVQAIVKNGNQLDVRKFDIVSCGQDTVTFINESIERSKIFNNRWVFDIDGEKKEINEWNATVVFPGPGTYTGILYLNENSACRDSADLIVHLYPGIFGAFELDFDSCSQNAVRFLNFSHSDGGDIIKNIWDFGDENSVDEVSPIHIYSLPGDYNIQLIVEDENTCKDTVYNNLKYYPVPENIDVRPSRYLGCAPVSITFTNNTEPFVEGYKIEWDFGDGGRDTVYNPTHIYEKPGFYTVLVRITSPLGCIVTKEFNEWLEIRPAPVADFDFDPKHPNIVRPEVTFDNKSQGASVYFWDFGTGDNSFDFEPVYTFPDTGYFAVTLIATSENHCDDTIQKMIFISPDVVLYFPNAFSPNGDGLNDEFMPIGAYQKYIENYSLTIWDRWGGKVFETERVDEAWFGNKFNTGNILPQGVYVYKYYFTNPRGKVFEGRGTVTLIK